MEDKTPKQLAAELALLREYDRVRTLKGHDYGCGQRASELARRQRELESVCWAGGSSAYELERDATRGELLVAFTRVGKPRYKRAFRESYRWNTPSTKRTFAAWNQVAHWVGANLS